LLGPGICGDCGGSAGIGETFLSANLDGLLIITVFSSASLLLDDADLRNVNFLPYRNHPPTCLSHGEKFGRGGISSVILAVSSSSSSSISVLKTMVVGCFGLVCIKNKFCFTFRYP
jgi:hypothetical protein